MYGKKKFNQGVFRPTNPQKYVGDLSKIYFRSSWERKVMRWCDTNVSVVKWTSEELIIPYFSRADGKNRRYFIDFVVQMINTENKEEILMIEIKPHKETIQPVRGNKKQTTFLREAYTWTVNQDKWEAAHNHAKNKGWKFLVLTEYDIGIKKRPANK